MFSFSFTLINELKYIVSLNFNEFKTHLIDKNQFNKKYLIILKKNSGGKTMANEIPFVTNGQKTRRCKMPKKAEYGEM